MPIFRISAYQNLYGSMSIRNYYTPQYIEADSFEEAYQVLQDLESSELNIEEEEGPVIEEIHEISGLIPDRQEIVEESEIPSPEMIIRQNNENDIRRRSSRTQTPPNSNSRIAEPIPRRKRRRHS